MDKRYDLKDRVEVFARAVIINRIEICRKEVKERRYWLKLIGSANSGFEREIDKSVQESTGLMNIFGAIF